MPYLLKTEPDVYSFSNLRRDGETVWDGVANPQAVKYLREMTSGERVAIYHTGKEKAVVGTATVVSVDASDAKLPRVLLRCGNAVPPKALVAIKAEPVFAASPLLRQGRLSVVPLDDAQYEWLTS